MLSLVTAAEHQYRHDVWTRDRDNALLASIREHRAAEAAAAPVVPSPVTAAPRAKRAAWPRPIGAHRGAEACTTVCATA
ncbi:hypothetical protein HF576_04485 [Microbacterium sp. CFH 90308]|uniref:Uncharacterized protein n=1 Tax=Microbacterium salsuginis TaxID=2722803 RepID=A0ABX1K9K7_9MICO|nr:hypothetical protein [Microbacterium sp. CFH 90308]NLP83095.1 hypothetical protein [Microbacterium sp. CFH 90308]